MNSSCIDHIRMYFCEMLVVRQPERYWLSTHLIGSHSCSSVSVKGIVVSALKHWQRKTVPKSLTSLKARQQQVLATNTALYPGTFP